MEKNKKNKDIEGGEGKVTDVVFPLEYLITSVCCVQVGCSYCSPSLISIVGVTGR